MNVTPKIKGPVSAATDPDQAQSNPMKGKPMNRAGNTTPEARHARDAAVASAMRDLESDICDLANMAMILGDLLEHDLIEVRDGKRIVMPEPGQAMKVLLGYQQLERLSFAWNDVIERALTLKKRWNAAADAGEVS